ncbi:FecR family protein [Spirosoma endophyticum]|uniref:FecR family protein n=1 Tax=Spirosoma endophyticum TaxID=662367 RepID=A0A1I2CF70_9BACT|nr:FecR domain-containing protein [Spirosoma endophyticum]SFE66330.1 FecR family protein [Spirosoma endophyticum]
MESEINKALIVSHFARKTSPLQRELIAQWLRQRENEEQYYEWLEEWEIQHPQYLTQPERSFQRYVNFLTENPHKEEMEEVIEAPIVSLPIRWYTRTWLVAASVLLVLGLGALLFRNQILYRTYQTPFGKSRFIRLDDGSTVALQPNSTLRVPRWGFGQKTRDVLLRGEANFSVTHTATNQKFVVKTDNQLEVVVLGTEFTVFARKRGARVVLNRGKVQLQYQEGQTARQLTMKPGDLVLLDRKNHIALKTVKQLQTQPVVKEKRFVFQETTLEEVAYMLEENYGLQVKIKDQALAGRVLMGSFQADNVDQLLQSISELLDVNVVRQGNQVQIMDK